jgi:hypothetical protein
MKFSPCTGECTKEGTHCVSCERSHEEIAETSKLITDLITFAHKMEYENPEDFISFVARNVIYNLQIEQKS